MNVNIVFPVLNEELRLRPGIEKTVDFLEKTGLQSWMITIVDNGSTDETWHQITEYTEKDGRIKGIRLTERGVGWALYNAIKQNEADIIGYMDVDLSTDLSHLPEALAVFEKCPEAGIVKGNRLDRQSQVLGRKAGREFTSRGLNWLLHVVFRTRVSDVMCGFQFFRRETAEQLIRECSSDKGWFYCAEMLLRADRKDIPIIEIPVKWTDDYNTKVKVFKLIWNYLNRIVRLRWEFWRGN